METSLRLTFPEDLSETERIYQWELSTGNRKLLFVCQMDKIFHTGNNVFTETERLATDLSSWRTPHVSCDERTEKSGYYCHHDASTVSDMCET